MQNHDDRLDNIGDDASKSAMAANIFDPGYWWKCEKHNVCMAKGEPCPHCQNEAEGGLLAEATLRDWFAGQALAGLLASRAAAVLGLPKSAIVQDAYELADAMLTARKGKP